MFALQARQARGAFVQVGEARAQAQGEQTDQAIKCKQGQARPQAQLEQADRAIDQKQTNESAEWWKHADKRTQWAESV